MAGSKRRNHGYSVSLHRASGRWAWAVTTGYDQNGKQVRERGYESTEQLAIAKAIEVKSKLNRGKFVPTGKDTRVHEYLESWLDLNVRPFKEPKTVKYYETYVRLYLNPSFGNVPLRKLAVAHVQNLVNEKCKSGLSASTVHGIVRTLRKALQDAWKQELIEQNVAQKVTLPKLEQKEPEHLEPEEAQRLLSACKGHVLENLIKFALTTGVRIGEASGLTWDNVDLDRATVKISGQLQRINGVLQIKTLKSRSSRRTLALSQSAIEALQSEFSRHILARSEFGEGFNSTKLVFLNSEFRPLDPRYVDKHLKLLCAEAKVPVISFHKLRHTAATLMVASGVEIHQVKEQLGHSQMSLTSDLYAHGIHESQRRAVNKLDQVLRNGKLSA